MTTPIYDTSVPSHIRPLLHGLIGRKMVNMIRFNRNPIKRLTDVFEIEPKDFFSLCLGPVLLYFEDGLVFGGSSNPSQNTVLIWVEKNESGEMTEYLKENDPAALPFYAQDFEPWKHFLGQTVSSVTIITEIDVYDEKPISSLPNERGLMLGFDNGLSLIISHGLNDNSDDTTIITPDQISSDFDGRLVYTKIVSPCLPNICFSSPYPYPP